MRNIKVIILCILLVLLLAEVCFLVKMSADKQTGEAAATTEGASEFYEHNLTEGGEETGTADPTQMPETVDETETQPTEATEPEEQTETELPTEAEETEDTESTESTDAEKEDSAGSEETQKPESSAGAVPETDMDVVPVPPGMTGSGSAQSSKPTGISYEAYLAMNAAEQSAYRESYSDISEFFAWYNSAKAKYDAQQNEIDAGDGSVDLGDIINGNGSQ